jgi:RimJ/RimL family protein N-acetyltransferase
MVPVPSFETTRLILKPLSLGDISSYETHFVDYEVIRHLSAVVPWPYPRNGVSEFFQKVLLPPQGISRWSWGLLLKENPTEVIGCVELWRPGNPENRGFWLGRKYWGRGLMGEAVQPVIDYAFKDLGFDKLVFTNAVGNLRSRRIKEKTGARLIEVRPAKFVDPLYSQHEIWE